MERTRSRVQIRRKQSYASKRFLRHDGARQWATATERRIDPGDAPIKRAQVDPTTFEHLIDPHMSATHRGTRRLLRWRRYAESSDERSSRS
jgi:hypothetical protein